MVSLRIEVDAEEIEDLRIEADVAETVRRSLMKIRNLTEIKSLMEIRSHMATKSHIATKSHMATRKLLTRSL